MGILTRDQIISDALSRGGNDSLTTLAQTWLNELLDRLYTDYRWPEQEKTMTPATLAAATTSVAFPSDFVDVWNEKGIRIADSSNNHKPLELMTPDYLDTLVDPDLAGRPDVAVIDFNAATWRPYPVPDVAYTWKLRYKHKPAALSSNTTPLFRNDAIMVQGVYVAVLQHEDDERYASEFTVLSRMIERYLKGKNISPSKAGPMRLNTRVFRGISNFR